MPRTVLRDDQWDRIEGFLPGKSTDCGVTAGDNRLFVEKIRASGAVAVIPARKNRIKGRDYDKAIYKERNDVERLFQKLKHYRRIATRYEKLARNYMAMLSVVATIIWLA